LDRADLLLFDDSLEASNATAEELIDLARDIARRGDSAEAAADLKLKPEELLEIHEDRVFRATKGSTPGLADTLLLEFDRRSGGVVVIDKLDVVEALAALIVGELTEARTEAAREALKKRRPVVGFVLDRLVPALKRPAV
jgi:hypothetical protein